MGNLTVKKRLNQDRVVITTSAGRQCWGYCSTIDGQQVFLPLSGFPMELVQSVQDKLNAMHFPQGGGPDAAIVIDSGRTAAEQDADYQAIIEELDEDE